MKDRYDMQRTYTKVLTSQEMAMEAPDSGAQMEQELENIINQKLRSRGQSPLKGMKQYQEDREERNSSLKKGMSPSRG